MQKLIPGATLWSLPEGGGEKEKFAKYARDQGSKNQIIFTGWVEDNDLVAFYDHALAFVYPSFYEGFGLQTVEAMARGCPVLTANRTSLPEVWGNQQGLFNPDDEDDLKSILQRIIDDSQFRSQLSDWSAKRGQEFHWKKAAEETFQCYRQLMS